MSRIGDARFLCLVCFLCLTTFESAVGEEPGQQKVDLTWSTPFEAISASTTVSPLVFIVITNDDPLDDLSGDAAAKSQTDKPAILWCKPIIESVFKRVLRSRPDLKDHYVLQPIAAGTPKLLTNGIDRTQPERAMLALCDSDYRLLALQIGVPDIDEMLTLIEDAQFVQTLQNNVGNDHADLAKRFDGVTEYNSKRMPRLWREAVDAMKKIVRQNVEEDDDQIVESDSLKRRALARIGESFEETYLQDVKQRFAFDDASDRVRLAVIEQHTQARQPWCDAMLPFVEGSNFKENWTVFAELVWKQSPVTRHNQSQELLNWWDSNAERKMVVLALDPPILKTLRPWPPIDVDSIADKRNLGWTDLENAASKHPYRHVNAEQLATLMRARNLKPIDIELPSRARYIVFDPKRSSGVVIREGDLPAKHIGRIKRSITK
jgi:hypothetical protein